MKGLIAAALLVLGSACVQSGVNNYEQFRSAVDSGAPCSELLDIRAALPSEVDLDRVDADLREIGCYSRESARTDL